MKKIIFFLLLLILMACSDVGTNDEVFDDLIDLLKSKEGNPQILQVNSQHQIIVYTLPDSTLVARGYRDKEKGYSFSDKHNEGVGIADDGDGKPEDMTFSHAYPLNEIHKQLSDEEGYFAFGYINDSSIESINIKFYDAEEGKKKNKKVKLKNNSFFIHHENRFIINKIEF